MARARFNVVRAVAVAILGLVAFGLWLAEVVWVKGWPGLAWLSGYPYAAVGVAALVAVGVLVALGARPSPVRIAGFIACTTSVGLGCFELSREAILNFSGSGHVPPSFGASWAGLAALPLSALLAAVGLFATVRGFLSPLPAWTILYLVVAFGVVLPAAMVTIHVFPAIHGGYTDYVHAVKMGYHGFWVVVLTAAAVALGARTSSVPHDRARAVAALGRVPGR
jgi:hypothetical protein